MSHSTTETYKMKREILTFCGKISERLRKPERKFFADMLYGILASGSCLLNEISQELHEGTKKINTVDEYISKAFPAYKTPSYTINSDKPIFWKGDIPKDVLSRDIPQRYSLTCRNISTH